MTLNVDWFSIFSGDTNMSSPAGGGGCNFFPGCSPSSYRQAPYYEDLAKGVSFTWMLPDAAHLSQLVVSNWIFGSTGEGNKATQADFRINGQLIASKQYDGDARQADRGSVWDLNLTVLEGTTVNMHFRNWKGVNQISNSFVASLTGTWLRDI